MYIRCMCLCRTVCLSLCSVCMLNPQIIPYSSSHPPHLQSLILSSLALFPPSSLSIYLFILLSHARIHWPAVPAPIPVQLLLVLPPFPLTTSHLIFPSLHLTRLSSWQSERMCDNLASEETVPFHMQLQCAELHSHFCK